MRHNAAHGPALNPNAARPRHERAGGGRDDLTLTFAVENVTNEGYRIHGSGVNEPGRNFVFGLEMTF